MPCPFATSRARRKSRRRGGLAGLIGTTALLSLVGQGDAQSGEEELAKLANAVSSPISVPFQFNWDRDIGPERDGRKFQLNIHPVVPAKLGTEWTLISRAIVPVVDQRIPFIGDGSDGANEQRQRNKVGQHGDMLLKNDRKPTAQPSPRLSRFASCHRRPRATAVAILPAPNERTSRVHASEVETEIPLARWKCFDLSVARRCATSIRLPPKR
jgi:hypothetical protein